VFFAERDLLIERGHQVREYREDNQRIETMNRLALAEQTIWSTPSRRRMREVIRDWRPTLVHFHNTFPLISPAVYSVCQDAGVPVVQTLHNYRLLCPVALFYRNGEVCEECLGKPLAWPGVVHACYRESRVATGVIATMLAVHRVLGTWSKQVDLYVALSEFARGKFVTGGLPANKIVVNPNFLASDPGVGQGSRSYAVCVGRLSPEKGVRAVLQAWKRLGNEIPLRIIGDGPLRDELQSEATRGGLTAVSFDGRLERAEVMAAIQGARFVVMPSECYENFPVVIAEAFACGTPVVASALGSTAEIVDDGRTGLHFKAGDGEDLAAKVQWAWTHAQRMEEFGRAARAEYLAKYTADCKYRSLMLLYTRVMEEHKGPAN
jgi:glycosyltransferase involved in cell wall biosynthesis